MQVLRYEEIRPGDAGSVNWRTVLKFAPRFMTFVFALLCLGLASGVSAQEAMVVQPFSGSEYIAQYSMDFDQYTVFEGNRESFTERTLEGQTRGTVLVKPEGKGNFEILRSFKNALTAAGFTILFSDEVSSNSNGMRSAVSRLHETNSTHSRPFENIDGAFLSANNLGYITTFPEYYLSASIVRDGQETVFALNLSSERNHYLIEEITTAAMEENTVTINEEMLTRQIEEAGSAILYGIEFDTGTSVIRPSSTASLRIVANVLQSQPGSYYIVGHTDDTGAFDSNMALSRDRAASVITALTGDYSIDAGRLQAGGIGPMAPVASNTNEAGRQLNRRVELVRRLDP